MSAPVRQSVRELADAGWLAVDGAGDVTLTAKSRNDRRFLLRSNGLLDIVPLAKKEMGTVQSVQANEDGTVAAINECTQLFNRCIEGHNGEFRLDHLHYFAMLYLGVLKYFLK